TLMMAPQIAAGEPVVVPADLDAEHSWSFIGDVARALVAVSRDERSWGHAWHVPSTATVSIRALTTRFAELVEAPVPKLVRMSAEELALAGASDPVVAEFPEMQYMYQRPFVLDASKTERTFGLEPTPLDEALLDSARGLFASA